MKLEIRNTWTLGPLLSSTACNERKWHKLHEQTSDNSFVFKKSDSTVNVIDIDKRQPPNTDQILNVKIL